MTASTEVPLNPGQYLRILAEGENGYEVRERIYRVCAKLFPASKVHMSEFGCVIEADVVAGVQPGDLHGALNGEGIQHTFDFMTYERSTYCRPEKARPTQPPAQSGFPRFWELFPIILPRALRARVYEPSHEDLKEDYLKERSRWRTPWARRWVTFAFTFRTGLLVGQCCWAGLSASARKGLMAFIGLVLGERVVAVLREKFSEWLGRLL